MAAVNFCLAPPIRHDRRDSAIAHRALIVATLMMTIGVYASPVSATSQSQTVDLSRQPISSPPQDFEFWYAGEPDSHHWTVVRDARRRLNSPRGQRDGGMIRSLSEDETRHCSYHQG
jgi:hypothetical protein